ncbi:hypothetical protein AgCh_018276 [Apium graveolens]
MQPQEGSVCGQKPSGVCLDGRPPPVANECPHWGCGINSGVCFGSSVSVVNGCPRWETSEYTALCTQKLRITCPTICIRKSSNNKKLASTGVPVRHIFIDDNNKLATAEIQEIDTGYTKTLAKAQCEESGEDIDEESVKGFDADVSSSEMSSGAESGKTESILNKLKRSVKILKQLWMLSGNVVV